MVGIFWLFLTVAFEFSFAHFVFIGRSRCIRNGIQQPNRETQLHLDSRQSDLGMANAYDRPVPGRNLGPHFGFCTFATQQVRGTTLNVNSGES